MKILSRLLCNRWIKNCSHVAKAEDIKEWHEQAQDKAEHLTIVCVPRAKWAAAESAHLWTNQQKSLGTATTTNNISEMSPQVFTAIPLRHVQAGRQAGETMEQDAKAAVKWFSSEMFHTIPARGKSCPSDATQK